MFNAFIFIFIVFVATSTSWAGFPPTTSKGSGDSTDITTFKFRFPNVSFTHSGTTATFGTVGVASGGTGQTSLTANNVILGNGTSAVQFVAPGTSGNVLTSNGTAWISDTPANPKRIYKAYVAGAAETNVCNGNPCTIYRDENSFISGNVSRSATGTYSFTSSAFFTAGAFVSCWVNPPGGASMAITSAYKANASGVITGSIVTRDNAGGASDSRFVINCQEM
jgi:hypothetical protein